MVGIASVTVDHFDAGRPEVSLLLGGEFLRLGVQGKGPGIPGFIRVAGKSPVILHDLIIHILIRNGRAIIQMQQIVQIADFHLIGCIFRLKGNRSCLLIKNNCHVTLLLYPERAGVAPSPDTMYYGNRTGILFSDTQFPCEDSLAYFSKKSLIQMYSNDRKNRKNVKCRLS